MTKWAVQKQTHSAKHAEQQDITDIQNKIIFMFFCFFRIFIKILYLLKLFKKYVE